MNPYELVRKVKVGARVRIKTYMIGRLAVGGPQHDERVEGQEAIIVSADPSSRSYSDDPVRLTGRVLGAPSERQPHWVTFDACDRHWEFEVLSEGTGAVTPGVDYPFSELELSQQRFKALEARLLAIDWRHQGYENAATFLAVLYLRNCRPFIESLPRLRRKDGRVHPKKVQRAFKEHKLQIDDWAYEFPFELPAEFAHYSLGRFKPKVNWDTVAAEFAAEPSERGANSQG